jgi:hypothetical protein
MKIQKSSHRKLSASQKKKITERKVRNANLQKEFSKYPFLTPFGSYFDMDEFTFVFDHRILVFQNVGKLVQMRVFQDGVLIMQKRAFALSDLLNKI